MKEPRTTTHCALRAREFREQQLRYEASGKSVTAFCRGEGVAESTFYQRRSRLKGGKRVAPRSDPTVVGKSRTGFIDAGTMVIAVPGDQAVSPRPEPPPQRHLGALPLQVPRREWVPAIAAAPLDGAVTAMHY